MAKRLKASYYQASTTTWTDFSVTYKDSGGADVTSNALIDVIYEDNIHSPLRTTLVLNNQSGSPFSNSTSNSATAFSGVLDRYNRVKVIDDNTKQIYFYGFVYEEEASYDPMGGQRLKLVCYDFLKELQDTTTKGASSYRINTGANNFASIVLNQAQAGTSGVGVSNLEGRASAGIWETSLNGNGYIATRGGVIKSLIAEHSKNINASFAVTSPNTTRFTESVVDIFKQNKRVYKVDDGEKPNILTHIQNLAVEDPHSTGSSVETIFGYDYYLAPDFNSTLVTATPRDAYFNYFKRGTRPTASTYGPKAFGLNLELPSPDTTTGGKFQETGQRQPIISGSFAKPRNQLASSVTMDYPEYYLDGTDIKVESHTVEFERIEASSISGGDNFKWRDYRIESGTAGLTYTRGNTPSSVPILGSSERLKVELTTLNADQSSTSNTSFTFTSTAGFYVGQKVGIGSDATDIYDGNLDTTFFSSSYGEILTVSAIDANGTSITLTRGENETTYSSGDKVFGLDAARIQYINRTGSYTTADIILSHVDPHIDTESLYWGGAKTWYGMTTTASSFVVADRPKTNHFINRKVAISFNMSEDAQTQREKVAGYLQARTTEITKGSVSTFRPPRTYFDNLVASIQSTSSTTQTFTLGKTPLTTQTTDNIDSSQTVITVVDNSRFYNTQVIQIDSEKMTVSQAPPRITQLKGTLATASAGASTSFDVDSTVGMAVNMVIRIGSEDLKITAVTDGDTVVATRGHNGSTPAEHADDTQVDEVGNSLLNVTRGSASTSAAAHNTDYADIYAVDVNPQNYGVTEGMTVGKLDSNDAVTSYGYISAVDYSNRRITVTWNTGTISADDKIRIFVPVRAGDKIHVRDDTQNVDMDALITKVRYDEMNGVALASYNVEGYNDKHVSKARSFPTGGGGGLPTVEFPQSGSKDDAVSIQHFTDPGEPVFTATDDDTIAWAKHEIFIGGAVTEIAAGTTGNMTAGKDYYIYHIKGSSTYTAADDVTYTTLIKDYFNERLISIGVARASDDSNGVASFTFSKKVNVVSPKKSGTVDINNIIPMVSGAGTSGLSGLNFITEAVTDLTGNANEAFNASDTTLDVTSKGVASTEFPFWVGQVIKIDNEKLKVTAISGGANQLTVSRGFAETALAAHDNGTAIYGNYRHGSITPGYFNTSQRTIRIYTHAVSSSGIDSKVQTVDFGQDIGLGGDVEMLLSGSMELYVGSGTAPERIYWRTGGGGAEGSIHVDGGVLFVKNSSGTTTFASNAIPAATAETALFTETNSDLTGTSVRRFADASDDVYSTQWALSNYYYDVLETLDSTYSYGKYIGPRVAGRLGFILPLYDANYSNQGTSIGSASKSLTQVHSGYFYSRDVNSPSAPVYSFQVDTNTGMYNIEGDRLGFATAGALAVDITSAGNVQLSKSNATFFTKGSYSWVDDANTYITNDGSDAINIYNGGTNSVNIDSSGNLYVVTSGAYVFSKTGYTWVDDTNTYITRGADDQITMFTGGGEKFKLNSNGITAPLSSSSGTSGMQAIYIDVTTATNRFYRITSSKRYKENIRNLEIDTSNIYNLRPVNYTSKDTKAENFGLIAEEVDKHFPELVAYNEKGQADSVDYQMLSVLLLNEIQKIKKEINKLKENK